MKKLFYLPSLALMVLIAVSCSDDNVLAFAPEVPEVSTESPEVSILNLTSETAVAQEDTIYLKANVQSDSRSKFVWSVDGLKSKEASSVTDSVFKFVKTEVGNYKVTLTCINANGETSTSVNLSVYGKFRDGVFVLNEGSVFQENSKLTFINPKGVVTDSAYWKVNGFELGNASQDLFIGNGKIYFVAQNGKGDVGKYENEGYLTIANSETLKREATYTTKLSVLSWPTHVAALGVDDVFIRDNKGVYLFNPSNNQVKFIEGSAGAQKNRMAVVQNKVFVPASKSVLVLEAGKTAISHKIEFEAAVSGVVKAGDGNIYVSTTGTPNMIYKINAKDYSIIKSNEVTEGKLSAGWSATPGISAKGDTIYYGNASTKIYRHIFSKATSEYLIDAKEYLEDTGMAYNNLGVHPVTGEVYQTTIKGYGTDFLKNNISVFNFSQQEPKLSVNYKNYTHFPAGIFFTDDFR